MGLIVVILLSALVGWIASTVMLADSNQNPLIYIITGIIGALLGGTLMNFFGQTGLTGFNFYSFIIALSGSIILIFTIRLLRRI